MVTFDAEGMKQKLEQAVENQRLLRRRLARSPGDTELEIAPEPVLIEEEAPLALSIDESDGE